MSLDINPKTGKGWTDLEETVFAEIMEIGRMERIPAIHLYRRCGSNPEKALRCAREWYGLTEAQETAYEQTKAKRLAALAKARIGRRKEYPISTSEIAVQPSNGEIWL
jgi:hypothetical protein